MTNNGRLLQHIRAVMAGIRETCTDATQVALLTAADLTVNELLTQEEPAFFLDLLHQGHDLLDEGYALLGKSPSGRPRDALCADHRHAVLVAAIAKTRSELLGIVEQITSSGASAGDFLRRMTDWEAAFYARTAQQVPPLPSAAPLTRERLLGYLVKRFPEWKNLEITSFKVLHGGFSKKTVIFETQDAANGAQSLVMRAEPLVKLLHADGSDVTREFPMIQLMGRLGLPVAEALWVEDDPAQLGCCFMVSRKARGEMVGDTMGSREPMRPELLDSMLNTLYQLHAIRVDPKDELTRRSHLEEWLPHLTVRESLLHYVTSHLPAMATGAGLDPSPGVARALKWLEKNVPDCDEPAVILHMDFALNNLLVENNRVTAILDWETSRLGDPADELRWTQMTLNQYITMPELLRRYREATGREITPYRLAYSKLAGRVYATINCINSRVLLERNDNASPYLGLMAYRYQPMLSFEFDDLIAEAEAARK